MATFTKAAPRALRSTIAAPAFRTATIPRNALHRQAFRQQSRRAYSTEPPKTAGSSSLGYLITAVAATAAGYYGYTAVTSEIKPNNLKQSSADQGQKGSSVFAPTKADYQAVYDAIAHKLHNDTDYDDGSYGPVLLRLGWHASGTYDAETKTGGSNGATMRFDPESDHGANAGLVTARNFLEPIKKQFPWITYSDLWTLAASCAIQEMSGPTIPWRPGRQDRDVSFCTPDGRLPDASQGEKHLRGIFGRMGFNDQEIVALSGAHALGRCHTDRSGFEGPWTFSPITLTNDYYKLLIEEKWSFRKWNGPKQFEDVKTKTLMMLPTDMALIKDKKFRPWVEKYANDNDKFFDDFQKVLVKLFELGVPFKTGEDARIEFKRAD